MIKVVIFGAGDIAQLAQFYFATDSPYEVVAFAVNKKYYDKEYSDGKKYCDRPVVPFEEIENIYPPDEFKMFVSISYKDVNKNRAEKYYDAKNKGYELVSYVCSKSVHWNDTKIGDNVFIFENQTIQPYVTIGNNVTIWSGNHIGHHSNIGDHCFITSHVVISGHVIIKPYCFLGVNATISDGITIAKECVVGAGTTIVKNTQEKGVYIGEKAKLYIKDSSKSKYFVTSSYAERDKDK